MKVSLLYSILLITLLTSCFDSELSQINHTENFDVTSFTPDLVLQADSNKQTISPFIIEKSSIISLFDTLDTDISIIEKIKVTSASISLTQPSDTTLNFIRYIKLVTNNGIIIGEFHPDTLNTTKNITFTINEDNYIGSQIDDTFPIEITPHIRSTLGFSDTLSLQLSLDINLSD